MFEYVLGYIYSRDIDKTHFHRKILLIQKPDLKESAMTLAQQFRQEGRQEGQILAQQAAVLEVLDVRFAPIPEGLREVIVQITDSGKLHTLHRTAIRCGGLEEFAKSL